MHGRRTNLALALSGALVLMTATALDVGAAAATTTARRVQIQPAHASAELVVNGNAESTSPGEVPGWQIAGTAETVKYGASGFPSATSPGPGDRGKRFFGGGASASSRLEQFVDLTPFASQIQTGKVQAQVSAYLGGFSTQDDHVDLVVRENQTGTSSQPVFTVAGPPSDTRNGVTSLLHEQGDFAVSKKAAFLDVSLEFTRASGTYDDGYADDVSIKLINLNGIDPPPSAPAGAGVELLKNGHFDAGPGGTGGHIASIPSWNNQGSTVVKYGSPGFPAASGPVPTDHGPNFLAGGNVSTSFVSQTVGIPAGYDAWIDNGRAVVQLSEYVGGIGDDNDIEEGSVLFGTGHGNLAGPTIVTSPTPDERNDTNGLWYRSETAIVPVYTRALGVQYLCTRKVSSFCDGFVDDASLRLLNVPTLPAITNVTPGKAPRGATTPVTIAGTNFKHGANVTVTASGGFSVAGVVVVSASKITAKLKVAANAALGKYTVVVTNPDFGQASCAQCVTVT